MAEEPFALCHATYAPHFNPQSLIQSHFIFVLLPKKLISFLFHVSSFIRNAINMSDTTCPVCFDAFTAHTRKHIRCPIDSCAKSACRACYQTFLCSDDVSVPKCMFCNTQFTHSQLQHLGLTKAFLQGDFAKHQQDILFAQEQAMLPAAQAAVAHDRLVKGIDDQIKDIHAQIKQLQALKADLVHTKYQLQRQGPAQGGDHDHDHDHAEQFIHRCADSDCNGFVSSAWKCATCDKHTCAHCRELKAERDDPLHVCNPDTVASVALLKHDTKPCPNCKVLVHKTEGCDQMFCTQCKRLWSWNTGRFETRGHNPHYLQWMRDNQPGGMPREPGDVLCGREIDPHFLAQLTRILPVYPVGHDVYDSLASILHLRFHDLPHFLVDRTSINLTARKAFVSNAITLSRFKQTTRRNHLLAIKNDNIAQILQAVIQAATDIAFRFQYTLQHPSQLNQHTIPSFYNELFNLKAYANQELSAIHNEFNSSPLQRVFFSAQSKHFKLIH